MNHKLYLRILQDINSHQYNIDSLCAKLYTNDIYEFIDYLTHTFENNIEELTNDEDFTDAYHKLFYNIADICEDVEILQYISISLNKHVRLIKDELKSYNKKEKTKDKYYGKLMKLKSDMISNLDYVDSKMFQIYENDKIKFMEYLMFELKDIDAIYHILSTHKELVNITSNEDISLIEMVVRYFILNIDHLSDDDINYYKRLIVLILIRDEFDIEVDKIITLIHEVYFAYDKTLKEHRHDLTFVKNQLNKVAGFKVEEISPNQIILPTIVSDDRIDLTNLDTISIDYIKYANNTNVLYDDAFSYEKLYDGAAYIYVHVPDVDLTINVGSDLDKYIRNNVESIYATGYKRPMIPYNISKNLSLISGCNRPALTFRMLVNEYGDIVKVDAFKSIISVNKNLSKNKADIVINYEDFEYYELMNNMYTVAKKLRLNRHMKRGSRSRAGVIMDEFNIWTNIAFAQYFKDNNLPYPYVNYTGVDDPNKYMISIHEYLQNNKVDEETRGIVYSLGDTRPRTSFSTNCLGNNLFNKNPYSDVTNPLREYISLETDRVIKDLLINKTNNIDYWAERLSDDIAELSETTAKVKELYKTI